jgi:hypothetical protein
VSQVDTIALDDPLQGVYKAFCIDFTKFLQGTTQSPSACVYISFMAHTIIIPWTIDSSTELTSKGTLQNQLVSLE